jgi:hypothetical protein
VATSKDKQILSLMQRAGANEEIEEDKVKNHQIDKFGVPFYFMLPTILVQYNASETRYIYSLPLNQRLVI